MNENERWDVNERGGRESEGNLNESEWGGGDANERDGECEGNVSESV